MAWVLPRPRLVLGLVFVMAVASVALTVSKLEIQMDQLELISDDHPLIALTDRLEPFNFGGKTAFTVVIQASEPRRAITFLDALVSRIKKDSAHFEDVHYRVNPDQLKRWALFYLEKEGIIQVRDSVSQYAGLIGKLAENPDILVFLDLINREMASGMVAELFTDFLDSGLQDGQKPPMDLGLLIGTLEGISGALRGGRQEYQSPWGALFEHASFDLEQEGYFWEGNKSYLLLFVLPKKGGGDFNDTQNALDRLRVLIREARNEDGLGDVHAGVTGQEALNNDEMATVTADMGIATWASCLGVLILMIVFMRGLRRPLVEMAALLIGICWTFGWTTLVIGHLNILSVVFAPLLCGLGVDYGIHWLARYEEEEARAGDDRLAVINQVTDRSGPGIFLAGLSASLSLLPFVLTGFKGLIELGLITGMGILLILLANFTVLPALSVLTGGRSKRKARHGEGPRWMGFGASPSENDRFLLRLGPRSARLILVIVSLCVLWSLCRRSPFVCALRLERHGCPVRPQSLASPGPERRIGRMGKDARREFEALPPLRLVLRQIA